MPFFKKQILVKKNSFSTFHNKYNSNFEMNALSILLEVMTKSGKTGKK